MRAVICISNFYGRLPSLRIPHARWRLSYFASSSSKEQQSLFNKGEEFMQWLRRRTGFEISSVLSIGVSRYGRSLFASENIQDGDCILKIPYSAHLTPNKIQPEVESLIFDDVGTISHLAVVLLAEQKLGKDSEWFPYINSLPRTCGMHNTIFWTPLELEMIRQSQVYPETFNLKSSLAKEYSALEPDLKRLPQTFGDISLENFMHAYSLVISRAWGTSNGVSLIPFADFLNHDGDSEAVLLSDDDKEISEVIADRSYATGEEVLIRYGKFPNSTLMIDFGFTLPHNIYDQVQISMDIPLLDPLYMMKMEILHSHSLQQIIGDNCFSPSEFSFVVKEVKPSSRKGKGIPQSLRALVRVMAVSTSEELTVLAAEASQSDGRLARQPLKNKSTEIQAHGFLLSEFGRMIKNRDAAVKELESSNVPDADALDCVRRQMAIDLLRGEIRVLNSASNWITKYCESLASHMEMTIEEHVHFPMGDA